jgi:hypothetical protein
VRVKLLGGTEPLIILLLGAFAVMLVITLASEPWKHPDRMSIFGTLVAVAALLWSGANTFFTFFYHPEDLRVYLRFPKPLQVGTNTLDINYFLSNMGNQSVTIEDVATDELWVNSDRTNIGGAELHRCDDVGYLGNSLLTTPPPPEVWNGHVTLNDGALFASVRPARIYIDGIEKNSSSAAVEAGKMKVIGTTFETDPVPAAEYNTVVICPVVRFFDSRGQPVLAVCRGWQSTRVAYPPGVTLFGPPAGGPPAKLLPTESIGSCRTLRMSPIE